MPINYDIKKEWPKIKKELLRVSQEAMDMVKKGEKELVHVTRLGKKHVDVTALSLKMEHLYLLIGKEYVKAKSPGAKTSKMEKLMAELKKIHKEKRLLEREIKRGKGASASREKMRKAE